MGNGPRENAVRATLDKRPAGVIGKIYGSPEERTFTGLFNGARGPGTFSRQENGKPVGLFVGKAECEWDWPEAWDKLVKMGLVTYRLETVAAPGHKQGEVVKLHWSITDKGREVRADDLKWFDELMDARSQDETGKVV